MQAHNLTERNKKKKGPDVPRNVTVEEKKNSIFANVRMSKLMNKKILAICAAFAMSFIIHSSGKRSNQLELAPKQSAVVPGGEMPVASAVVGEETSKAITSTKTQESSNATIVVDSPAVNGKILKAKTNTSQPESESSNSKNKNETSKKGPLEGWIYEPKDLNSFWARMGDRPFLRELYSHVGKYKRVIDVGARGYNRHCKTLINSTTTEYFQIEPFPPGPDEMNNDGLLECYMGEVMNKYPKLKNSFDLVLDFGVFGWKPALDGLDESGIIKYVESVRFLLKDRGMWVLKVDVNDWVPNAQEFLDKYLLPYFEMGDFENIYKSGHTIKRGRFKFYFLYKK